MTWSATSPWGSASSYCFLCHFIAGIVLIVLLSLFHSCFPYFPLAVSTNFKEIKAISAVSPSRAVPPAWLSDYTHPKWDFVHPSLHISFFLPSSFPDWLTDGRISPKAKETQAAIKFFFSFFFFLSFFSYFEGLTFRDTSFMFLQSVSKGQSVL